MLAFVAGAPALAQLDTASRFHLEGGYEQGLAQPGPNAPYFFVYWNRAGVFRSSDTLRLAVAPVYLDGEYGIRDAFGARMDLGLGFSGGGYAFGQTIVRRGDEKRGESFLGHGGGPSVSLYPRFGDLGPAPLNGVLRLSASYGDYRRNSSTDPRFVLPPDEWTGSYRAGLRWGGQPPGLDRAPAMEISTWWQTSEKGRSAPYGYDGDRSVQRLTNLYWTRLLLTYPSVWGARVAGEANFGGGTGVDDFSAYRLGGMLAQNAEFPLILPGYFSREILARRYAHASLRVGYPFDPRKALLASLFAAGASVSPVPGTDPGGALHAGVGTGVEFIPRKAALRGMLSYGYSPTALRGGGRGGHGVALSVELDFKAPPGPPGRIFGGQEGLRWLLGSFGW